MDSTLFVQLNRPGIVVERILDHPLREKIEELEQVKESLESNEFRQAKIVLALLEAQIGAKWLPALQTLTDSGVFIGLDAQS